jgi:hypothetical protein
MQDMLKRTKESYEKDANLGPAAEVPAWGWVKEGEEKADDGKLQGQQVEVKKEDGVAG